ncbi:MAG: hypothetical protein HZA51_06360 [Planctomycetes bacterium]|nr:hypothetical protein [Planctomycetota bacterium]
MRHERDPDTQRNGASFVSLRLWLAAGAILFSIVTDARSEKPTRTIRDVAAPDSGAFRWCRYPVKDLLPAATVASKARGPFNTLINSSEAEPNDTVMQAQAIPLGFGMGQDANVTVSGTMASAADIDFYKATLAKGDIIGLACHVTAPADSLVGVHDAAGTLFFSNDDHGGVSSFYPPLSPWPPATGSLDSALTFVVPADGDYLLSVTPANASGVGPYALEIHLSRAAIETAYPTPIRQILFIDFNGATINARTLFGLPGRVSATLSPLSSFLSGWGLNAGNENAVIDAILTTIQSNFNALRLMALNGDFASDMMPGHFDIEIRNSRDHPDPFGQANASRVIVGGSISQLGISTIGIAEWIDPGNFSQSDTAVVLCDLLSANASDPNSINSIPRAGGVTIIDAIGIEIGNIVSHEAGHFLGNWHTRNDNATACIMDTGGDILNRAGVGNDGILGTMDDLDGAFQSDTFDPAEGVGIGMEKTDVNGAFALSTGKLAADMTAPMVTAREPSPASMLATISTVSVTFDEPVAGLNAGDLTVNGSAATTLTGTGAGPFVFGGFTAPADGMVTIILGAGITDLSGNAFTMITWNVEVHDCNGNLQLDATDIALGVSRDCPANGIPDECEGGLLNANLGADQNISVGQPVVIPAVVATGGTPPYTFAWIFNGPSGTQNSTDASPTFTPTVEGTHALTVQVTDSVTCVATDTGTVQVTAVTPPDGGGDGGGGDGGGAAPPCGTCGTGTMSAVAVVLLMGRRRANRRLRGS